MALNNIIIATETPTPTPIFHPVEWPECFVVVVVVVGEVIVEVVAIVELELVVLELE